MRRRTCALTAPPGGRGSTGGCRSIRRRPASRPQARPPCCRAWPGSGSARAPRRAPRSVAPSARCTSHPTCEARCEHPVRAPGAGAISGGQGAAGTIHPARDVGHPVVTAIRRWHEESVRVRAAAGSGARTLRPGAHRMRPRRSRPAQRGTGTCGARSRARRPPARSTSSRPSWRPEGPCLERRRASVSGQASRSGILAGPARPLGPHHREADPQRASRGVAGRAGSRAPLTRILAATGPPM